MKTANAADPTAVKERQRVAKDAQDQQRADLAELLKIEAFRRYVWRHINVTCGLMRTAASPNGSTQSHLIGQQDVGRQLWIEISNLDPLAIPKMMIEHHEAQRGEA